MSFSVAKLIDGSVVEKYLWQDKTTLLATYDENDNLLQRYEYVSSHTPVKFTEGNNTYYILTDQIGTPRVITDVNGNVIKEVDYDAFGNVVGDSNPYLEIPIGFAGGLYDADTGLVRFGYRDYDPEAGRWSARDPIGFNGGDSNLYGYVSHNPGLAIDLIGLAEKTDILVFDNPTGCAFVSECVRTWDDYPSSPGLMDQPPKKPKGVKNAHRWPVLFLWCSAIG